MSREGRPASHMGARVSVVLPVLDEAATLPGTLAALAPLREQGHELIVADGGSADGTVSLARRQADRVLAAPRGRASQMNAGAACASGDILLFLHADTRLPATALEDVVAATASRAWGRFDVRLDSPSAMLAVVGTMMNLRSRLTGIATGDQAIFVRREAFDAVGGVPAIALMEDIEFSTRMLRLHGRPACLRGPVLTSARRWESRGVWPTILLMWRLRALYFMGADPERLAREYGR